MKYKRILLKLSGEALANKKGNNIALAPLLHYAEEIKKVHANGHQIAVVIGGGNIYRGKEGKHIRLGSPHTDHMGMLASMFNAIALSATLTKAGIPAILMSRLPMHHIATTYHPTKALDWLTKGHIIVIGGGIGVPCFSFTTDSAGALVAVELGAEVLIKGTYIDGVYEEDPKKNPNATYYDKLSLQHALEKRLKVLDSAAMELCLEHRLPIFVYNATKKDRLLNITTQGTGGTLLYHE